MPPIEIERKFLIRSDSWKSDVKSAMQIKQGYLSQETSCSIRVRISGDEAWLNMKGVTVGAQRVEFEYPIPVSDAHYMLDALTCKPIIEKTRYLLEAGQHTWEIDVFHGDNAGLVVAEIELDAPDEAFLKPEWLGAEVTQDPRYYNTCLSSHPYNQWRTEDAKT